MKKILLTGANGQLGRCIQEAALQFPQFDFYFASKTEFNIADSEAVRQIISEEKPDYCINTTGYTDVEKAETEQEEAFQLNAQALKELAMACSKVDCTLIHFSTDYVFDGKQTSAYKENNATNPLNVYGASKLKGEEYIQEMCSKYFIIRTSWLYSYFGKNFMTSVLRWANEGRDLQITTEQKGSPTNGYELAKAVLQLIESDCKKYGVYHFSNKGEATWFDFAEKILEYSNQLQTIKLAKIPHYRTFAARPKYSVLDSSLFEDTFGITIQDWKQSLRTLLSKNNDKN